VKRRADDVGLPLFLVLDAVLFIRTAEIYSGFQGIPTYFADPNDLSLILLVGIMFCLFWIGDRG
jgi:hypothetical protein